MSLSQR